MYVNIINYYYFNIEKKYINNIIIEKLVIFQSLKNI